MAAEEQIVRHIHEDKDARPDSITIGTPSKGGEVKIYFNSDNPERATELVDNAFVIRSYANSKYLAAQEGK